MNISTPLSELWFCNICQVAMPVSHGPYHLIGDSHIERLMAHISGATAALSCGDALHPASFEMVKQDRAQYQDKKVNPPSVDNPVPGLNRSPINQFFASFPTFDYDPSITPSASYELLQKHHKWRRNRIESMENWERYQHALRKEFGLWYGAEDDLEAWHSLCRAIGLNPLPTTCERCEQVGNFSAADVRLLIEDTDC
jgi:hypothetical protein